MAGKVRDYPKLAEDIIDIVGKDNITSATRCATRLRLVLKVTPEGAHEKVAALPGVITVAENGGQFQVVIGTHVGEVHEAVMDRLDLSGNEEVEAPKGSLLNRIIATMSAVFAPFVYILAAAGILQGALIIITMFFPTFAETGTYEVLSFMSWTPFTFLPVFIAVTAARHFKTNEFIAMVCCLALVNPDWGNIAARIASGESVSFLFIDLAQTVYTSTVLPPLFLVLVLSYLEKWLNKHMLESIKALFVPFICFVIMVPLTLLVIGPLSDLVATGIAVGYNWLVNLAPVIAGAIIGGIWQVVVIFGVHWGITPVVLANFDIYGYDTFQAFQTCAVCAQVGACIGVALKTRNKEFRSMSVSSAATGFFGITEPIIYGITLRLKKPFICGCIGGAIGGVIVALFGSLQYVYAGLPGFLTVVNAYSPDNSMSLIGEIVGVGVATIVAAVLVYFVGFDDPKEDNIEDEEAVEERYISPEEFNESIKKDHQIIGAPIEGEVIKLSEVPDPVFSSGAMGKGVAIKPANGNVYAPVDGQVTLVFDTKHAIGITTPDGQELLIHFGVDTVNMQGDGFDAKVVAGQDVKKGDLLLTVDLDKVNKAGYSTVTPILVTNSDDFFDIIDFPIEGPVKPGDDLIAVIK